MQEVKENARTKNNTLRKIGNSIINNLEIIYL